MRRRVRGRRSPSHHRNPSSRPSQPPDTRRRPAPQAPWRGHAARPATGKPDRRRSFRRGKSSRCGRIPGAPVPGLGQTGVTRPVRPKGGSVNVLLYTALAFLPGAIFAVAAKRSTLGRGERRSRRVTGAGSRRWGRRSSGSSRDLRRLGRDYSRIAESDLPRRALRLQSVTPRLRRHPVRVLHRAGDPAARTTPVRPRPAAGDRGDPGAARSHLVAAVPLPAPGRARCEETVI